MNVTTLHEPHLRPLLPESPLMVLLQLFGLDDCFAVDASCSSGCVAAYVASVGPSLAYALLPSVGWPVFSAEALLACFATIA